jgi:hypothetical protein
VRHTARLPVALIVDEGRTRSPSTSPRCGSSASTTPTWPAPTAAGRSWSSTSGPGWRGWSTPSWPTSTPRIGGYRVEHRLSAVPLAPGDAARQHRLQPDGGPGHGGDGPAGQQREQEAGGGGPGGGGRPGRRRPALSLGAPRQGDRQLPARDGRIWARRRATTTTGASCRRPASTPACAWRPSAPSAATGSSPDRGELSRAVAAPTGPGRGRAARPGRWRRTRSARGPGRGPRPGRCRPGGRTAG